MGEYEKELRAAVNDAFVNRGKERDVKQGVSDALEPLIVAIVELKIDYERLLASEKIQCDNQSRRNPPTEPVH